MPIPTTTNTLPPAAVVLENSQKAGPNSKKLKDAFFFGVFEGFRFSAVAGTFGAAAGVVGGAILSIISKASCIKGGIGFGVAAGMGLSSRIIWNITDPKNAKTPAQIACAVGGFMVPFAMTAAAGALSGVGVVAALVTTVAVAILAKNRAKHTVTYQPKVNEA